MLRQPALLTRRRVKFTLLSPNPKFRWRWVASQSCPRRQGHGCTEWIPANRVSSDKQRH